MNFNHLNIKPLLFILFVFVALSGYTQNSRPLNTPKYDAKPLHFGYTIALNKMDFTVRNSSTINFVDSVYSIECLPRTGFNLGIVSNLKLTEYIDLRVLPQLVFGQRDMEYIVRDRSDSTYYKHLMKIESIMLDLPILFKYKAKRINNYRPYLIAGGSYKFDLMAQKKVKEEDKPKIRLRNSDFYYEIGFGIDYYLPYFKFSTEIKLAIGLLDVLKKDPTQFATSIDRLNSKMVVVSFHFE